MSCWRNRRPAGRMPPRKGCLVVDNTRRRVRLSGQKISPSRYCKERRERRRSWAQRSSRLLLHGWEENFITGIDFAYLPVYTYLSANVFREGNRKLFGTKYVLAVLPASVRESWSVSSRFFALFPGRRSHRADLLSDIPRPRATVIINFHGGSFGVRFSHYIRDCIYYCVL